MGTFTAQILVGEPHLNHGGIEPTHYLFLSENDRPAWILVNQNIFDRTKVERKRIVWIPNVENIFEEALLMIAIHVIKNKQIIDLSQKMFKKIDLSSSKVYEKLTKRLEESNLDSYENLTKNLNESQQNEIYQECRRIKNWPKVIVTVMKGSSIKAQLSVLKKYPIEFELCVSK